MIVKHLLSKVSYTYDPLGRRLQKTVHKNNASYQEEYLYDGEEEIAAYANKKLAQLKILSPSKNPVAIELNEKIFLPILDQAKNIRRLMDYSSQELQSYDYSAFGETTSSGSLFNPWRHKAKPCDLELNLY
ncbi:MAG: hypothetical protein Tsb0015_13130 [Simkaniaceae bacterium]